MKYRSLPVAAGLLAMLAVFAAFKKEALGSWKEKQLIRPEVLAERISKDDTANLLILNTGPVEDIRYAVNIGAMEAPGNLDKLKAYLKTISRDKEVVIYCGCCPLSVCPNLRPAYDALKELKFTNYKVLRLTSELKEDWTDKGYPMAR